MRCLLLCASLFALTVAVSFAGGAMAFEVASVKPAAPQPPGQFRISMGGDPGRVDYQGVSLKILIERAYSMKSYQVSGPDWLDSERFDVAAKLPEGAKQEDVPQMLQTLLAERFKLTVHREEKTLPVYALVVGKNGPKLQKSGGESPGFRVSFSPKGRKVSGQTTMDGLAGFLARMLDRPVLDMTELKDTYDVTLEWTPDDREGNPFGGKAAVRSSEGESRGAESSDAPNAPGLFAAVQETLGLKLESRKGPVAILVIDSADKAPTVN